MTTIQGHIDEARWHRLTHHIKINGKPLVSRLLEIEREKRGEKPQESQPMEPARDGV